MAFCCSVAKSCLTLCDPMGYSMPGFSVLYYLPEFAQLTSIESVMASNHLILCCPLLLLPSIFLSIRVWVTGEGPSGPRKREWQPTSVFLPWEPHEQHQKTKRHGLLTKIKRSRGLPRWHGVKESTCQCSKHKRCRFDLWGREDPLEKEMASQSSILDWKIPWTEEPGRLQSMGSQRVEHVWLTEHTNSNILFCPNLHIHSGLSMNGKHIFFLLNFLATLHGIWHLISPTRDRIHTAWTGSSAS